VLRRRHGAPPRGAVRAWGYPVTAIVYATISVWTLLFVVLQRPLESLAGVATLVVGAIVYGIVRR
jgi:APA family basic amino acid/polyamine antiporter